MKTLIIIGAGLSGTILANRLCRKYSVILLERENSIKLPKLAKESSPLATVPTFCYGLGGTTNLWHNGLIELDQGSISDPYFSSLVKKISVYKDEAISILSNNTINTKVEPVINIGGINSKLDKIIYPNTMYDAKLDSRVNVYTMVENIEFKFIENSLSTISFSSDMGKHNLNIDKLIVSSGGLNTPSIVNTITTSAGLGIYSDGKFIDHPMGFIGKIKIKKKFKSLFNAISNTKSAHANTKHCFKLHDKESGLTSCIYLRPCFTQRHSESLSKFKSKLGSSGTFTQRVKSSLNVKLFHPDIIIEILKYLFNIDIKTLSFNLMFVGEQKNRHSSIVSTVDANNTCINWDVSKAELHAYRRMITSFIEDNKNYIDHVDIPALNKNSLWSAAHYSSSVPVGTILDSNLKLKNINNVYVCDGSVINEHGYANTGLIITQLCLFLSSEVL